MKNKWSSESYRFDEVFTDTASQKRVYEVVAKPVVEVSLSDFSSCSSSGVDSLFRGLRGSCILDMQVLL